MSESTEPNGGVVVVRQRGAGLGPPQPGRGERRTKAAANQAGAPTRTEIEIIRLALIGPITRRRRGGAWQYQGRIFYSKTITRLRTMGLLKVSGAKQRTVVATARAAFLMADRRAANTPRLQ